MNLNFLPSTEMGNLIRAKDWSKTSLGSIHAWPESLITALGIILNSRFPMFLFWGPELISFYNDAYRPSLGNGGMHPKILGLPAEEAWADIWHIVKKFPEQVLNTGIATWEENQLIPIYRNGKTEDVYWTFSHSPVYNTAGSIEGIFVLCMETTQEVLSIKKLKESEERFRTLADDSPMFVFILDPDPSAHVSYWNKTWLEYTGQTAEQALGSAWDGILHPEDVRTVMDIYNAAFATKQSYYIPAVRTLRNDGEYRWHSFKGNPRYLPDGTFNGYIGVGIDIHETKTAENALRESEELFSALADNMENLAWIADGDGWIYWYNKRWYDYTGTSLQEMQGWGWQKVHHPDHVERILELTKKIWITNETFELTFPLRRHDGEYRWFLTRGRPITNSKGKIVRWFGTNTDITEQRETQELLEYRKALLEAHNESSVDGLLLVDAKGKIISYNKRFIEIWNMPQHIVDARDDEAALTFAMSQLVNPQQFIEKVKFLYAHPAETSTDILEYKDGKIIERHGYPVVSKEGTYYAWSWTFRDITQQQLANKQMRESEEKFRLLADSMPQFVWTGNEKGELNYFNKSVYSYSGLSEEEVEKNGWLQIVHPDERDENVKQWLRSIETGEIFSFEHRFRRHDGQYKWQLSRAVPQRDENGKIQMWVGTSTEIQKQKEQREELEKLVQERTNELVMKNNDLEKMNKELESFTYIASHDLQEPLRKIQTISTRIAQKEEQNLTHTGRDYFQRMQNAAKRMQRLIEDLLTFSRTSSGERKFEHIHLNTIVEEVEKELKESIHQNQIIIEKNELCALDIIPFQFRQLIFNLVNNSIKFVSPGTIPHIKISAASVRSQNTKENASTLPPSMLLAEKEYCCITVKDNGIGFDPQYSDRILKFFNGCMVKMNIRVRALDLPL